MNKLQKARLKKLNCTKLVVYNYIKDCQPLSTFQLEKLAPNLVNMSGSSMSRNCLRKMAEGNTGNKSTSTHLIEGLKVEGSAVKRWVIIN